MRIKEKYHKSAKEYRNKNKELIKSKQKKYRLENKQKISNGDKIYRNKNKESLAKKKRLYYENNKKEISEKSKLYRDMHKIDKREYDEKYRKENKDKISKNNKAYGKSIALYEAYFDKLTTDESPRLSSDGLSLEVKCRYCGRYIKVTNQQVRSRIGALNGTVAGEGNLYCQGEKCRSECPIYNQNKYPKGYKKASSREVNPLLRQLVLKRDNYACQKCGKTLDEAPLHVHHMIPAVSEPMLANDPDVCITLCKSCHKAVHSKNGCGYHELRCSNDDKIVEEYADQEKDEIALDTTQQSD